VHGIDVSSHDHSRGRSIDWAAQARSGVLFAYVKATEGTGYVNPYFESDYRAASRYGLYVGAYAFGRPDRGDPAGQADFFIDNARWRSGWHTLIPFLDIEWPYRAVGLGPCWGMSPAALHDWIRGFVDEVIARINRPPMIYTNTHWWNPCTAHDTSFSSLPLDIAGYTSRPPVLPAGWRTYTFWQYNDGPWPGDKNVFYGTVRQLPIFLTGMAAPAPLPHPTGPVPRPPGLPRPPGAPAPSPR
jgi:GH25 family lysozyme M1 (1,4-beta-N-acetylmuramidase)